MITSYSRETTFDIAISKDIAAPLSNNSRHDAHPLRTKGSKPTSCLATFMASFSADVCRLLDGYVDRIILTVHETFRVCIRVQHGLRTITFDRLFAFHTVEAVGG
jgi:hypothetical protein